MKKFLNIVIIFQTFSIILIAAFIASNSFHVPQTSAVSYAISNNLSILSETKKTFSVKPRVSGSVYDTAKPEVVVVQETTKPTPAQTSATQEPAKPVIEAPIAGDEPVVTTPIAPEKPSVAASHVSIPSVGINAPIKWNVNGLDMSEYLPVLASGAAHFKGTPLPGQGGSTLIFAHSSFDYDLPGNNDEIFRPLHNIQIGDTVYVEYKGYVYKYSVYQTKVIVPTDPEFVSQNGPERVMLMTCTPIGSTKNRLLVYAQRVY